jgi:hypothetical protein
MKHPEFSRLADENVPAEVPHFSVAPRPLWPIAAWAVCGMGMLLLFSCLMLGWSSMVRLTRASILQTLFPVPHSASSPPCAPISRSPDGSSSAATNMGGGPGPTKERIEIAENSYVRYRHVSLA